VMFTPPPLELPPVWDNTRLASSWTSLEQRGRRLAQNAGQGSSAFLKRKELARLLLDKGHVEHLRSAAAQDRRFYRAVLAVWQEDAKLAQRTLRQDTLHAVLDTARLTRFTTESLLLLLLREFEQLDLRDNGLFTTMATYIRTCVGLLKPTPRRRDLLETARLHGDWLLRLDAPSSVVHHISSVGLALDEFFSSIGLDGRDGGAYVANVRRTYYLDQLRKADPQRDHPVLQEIRREAVYKAPTPNGYFGHEVLRILCTPDQRPGDPWTDSLLHIAGDPRLTHTDRWKDWWQYADTATVEKVCGWLSAEDLRLFLETVDEYGTSMGKEDLVRMFPARKTFLEGLLDLGLVRETRLFLGSDARGFMRRRVKKHVLTDVTRLTGVGANETAVIFIDCGHFHLIEGSHSFRLWIYIGSPVPAIQNRRKRDFPINDLRKEVPLEFMRLRGEHVGPGARAHQHGQRHKSIVHNGLWQGPTLEFLHDQAIELPAAELMDKATLAEYQRRHGPVRKWTTVDKVRLASKAKGGRR
jgi:hypothetical protein